MPEVIINGPEGRLEGRYHHAGAPDAPLAVVLHPHPLHGGTMNNRVVYNMYHAFVQRSFSVLRFNFRGVGKSGGAHDGGRGEQRDVVAGTVVSVPRWSLAQHWIDAMDAGASDYVAAHNRVFDALEKGDAKRATSLMQSYMEGADRKRLASLRKAKR